MKQNVTIALEQDLLRRARVLAADRGTSISRLLADKLERIVMQAERYERAMATALGQLNAGLHLGDKPAARDALHEG